MVGHRKEDMQTGREGYNDHNKLERKMQNKINQQERLKEELVRNKYQI